MPIVCRGRLYNLITGNDPNGHRLRAYRFADIGMHDRLLYSIVLILPISSIT